MFLLDTLPQYLLYVKINLLGLLRRCEPNSESRRIAYRFSTSPLAGAMEFARIDPIFVPYSHNDETKTLLYPITSVRLMNADGE